MKEKGILKMAVEWEISFCGITVQMGLWGWDRNLGFAMAFS